MKDWKIHLGWALAVPVIAFLWGRWTRERPPPEPRVRGAADLGRSARPGLPALPATAPAETPSPEGSPIPGEAEDFIAEIRRLLKSEKPADRYEAWSRLPRVPDGPERKDLLLLGMASPDQHLRISALNHLLELPWADVGPVVLDVLKSDPEGSLRRIAAEVLGARGGPGTMEALLGAVHDPERYVQATAAGALGRLGQPGPAEELVPRVAADLSSPDGALRREAVKDLALLNLASTIPLLLGSLRDPDGGVRLQAAGGLGELDSPDLLGLLEGLKKDPDPNVAGAAEIAIMRHSFRKQ